MGNRWMSVFLSLHLALSHQAFQSHLPSQTLGVPLLSRGLSFAHFHHSYFPLFSYFAYSHGIQTGFHEKPKLNRVLRKAEVEHFVLFTQDLGRVTSRFRNSAVIQKNYISPPQPLLVSKIFPVYLQHHRYKFTIQALQNVGQAATRCLHS